MKITLVRNVVDRTNTVFIDKTEIISVNYDEHGSAGLDIVEDMAKEFAEILKVELTEIEE